MDQGAGPSSGAAPSSPAASGLTEGKSAAKAAPEKTPKQGQQAEEGAAGEGRVQGTGKRGNLTETEGRSTGWTAFNNIFVAQPFVCAKTFVVISQLLEPHLPQPFVCAESLWVSASCVTLSSSTTFCTC